MNKKFTVCYFGTYRKNYSRNQIFIAGLRKQGVQVIECHETLWEGVSDRVGIASGGWLKPRFWWRVIRVYFRLIVRIARLTDYDILMVGYPGHFDVFLAYLIARIKRKPLAWDVLNSLYLISVERGISNKSPLTIAIVKRLEKWACRLPDMLFLDTRVFVDWFVETHQLQGDRFEIVQIGVDDRVFIARNGQKPGSDFVVIYYGSYIPNHGVEYIVEAASLLKDDPAIRFLMIGEGPDKANALKAVERLMPGNVQFIDWLEHEELINQISNSNLVLGAFGTSRQLELTNNNKIYEGLSMRKPVLTGASPALPDVLTHGVHVFLCRRGDPASLAEGIRQLKSQPELCKAISRDGEQLVREKFGVDAIGKQVERHLRKLLP